MLCTVVELATNNTFDSLERTRSDVFTNEWHSVLCNTVQQYVELSVKLSKQQKANRLLRNEPRDGTSVPAENLNLALVAVNAKSMTGLSEDSGSSKVGIDGCMSIYTNYQYNKLKDLMRLMCNMLRHSQSLHYDLKKAVGLTTCDINAGYDAFLAYFTIRFPGLVTTVFNIAVKQQVPGIKTFSRPFVFPKTPLCPGTDFGYLAPGPSAPPASI